MYFKKTSENFDGLVESYLAEDFHLFEQKIKSIFSAQDVSVKLKRINSLIEENKTTHAYVTQIMLECTSDIKIHATPNKILNLISALDFSYLAYQKDFERMAQEIDEIENSIIDYPVLFKLNKQMCVFIFGNSYNTISKQSLELLYQARELMVKNMEILKTPLDMLYKSKEESLIFFNAINSMKNKAHRVHNASGNL